LSQQELQAVIEQIADALGETGKKPREQIELLVKECGVEFVQDILRETQVVEAQGGMLLPDESRRRTAGGVFFYLARRKVSREVAKVVFPIKKTGQKKKSKAKPPPAPLPVLNWEDRLVVIQPLLAEQGVLSTVKITLIGRPGRIDKSRKDLVVTTMSHATKNISMPKGVPALPEQPTLYTVYISSKQWSKVAETIADPEDALIIDGTCAYDEAIKGMAVFALSVTSKQLEIKKRQTQKESNGQASGASPAPPRQSQAPQQPKLKRDREFDGGQPTTPPPAVPALPGAPSEVMQKLSELYASASLFRQKVAAIQSKPAGQQFGLEMTQKLLKNVEDEIASIEKKYKG
jgi:hypothetical protein